MINVSCCELLTSQLIDDKIFSCSDTKGSSRRKGMICFEGIRRESLRFDNRTINIDFVLRKRLMSFGHGACFLVTYHREPCVSYKAKMLLGDAHFDS